MDTLWLFKSLMVTVNKCVSNVRLLALRTTSGREFQIVGTVMETADWCLCPWDDHPRHAT